MRLRERSVIARPAAKVWPFIIRPEYFQRWNAKISAMDATGEFRVGQPFTTHYQWNARPLQCASVATEIQEGRLLELLHTHLIGPGIRPDMEIRERITLHEAAIWLISNFGARVGPDLLKQMCERDA